MQSRARQSCCFRQTYHSKHLKSSIINLVRSFIAPASRLCFAAPIGLPCGTTLLRFDRSPWQRVMASRYLKYIGRVSPAFTTSGQLLGPCKLHLYLQDIQDVIFLQPLCALVLHNVFGSPGCRLRSPRKKTIKYAYFCSLSFPNSNLGANYFRLDWRRYSSHPSRRSYIFLRFIGNPFINSYTRPVGRQRDHHQSSQSRTYYC